MGGRLETVAALTFSFKSRPTWSLVMGRSCREESCSVRVMEFGPSSLNNIEGSLSDVTAGY